MRRFGLIGQHLTHSYSPDIHALIGEYEYKLYPTEPQELSDFIQNTELHGFNVTIPYKKSVIPYCGRLTERASAAGSVNTMLRGADGKWVGDNTDYDGFLYLLGGDAESFKGQKALILGSGGSSATVRAALSDLGMTCIIISRSGKDNYDNIENHADAALIVNTTPVGMYPKNGASPIDLTRFPACRLVLDLIYNPAKTALMLQADKLGIASRGGLPMLCAQGIYAGGLFTGHKLPPALIEAVAEKIRRKTLNIALIGMPGCGKTTVARHLSGLSGREFIDTDHIIAEKSGMSIPDLFTRFGEAHFRELESEVLRDVSAKSGKIIATGGGVVTIPENRRSITQNSICIFLDCDKSRLDITGRPLSASAGIDRLLEVRLPRYREWSDFTVRSDDPLSAAEEIFRRFLA